eukprot:641034_1
MLQNVPNITLKLIPSPTASFDVAQLVQVETTDVNVDEFYLGPGRIQIFEHINAPVGDFEVLQQPHDHVCMHIKTGLTLNSGHVIYDYNKQGDVAFLSGLSAMPINAPSYSPHTSYECEKDIFEIEYFTKLDNIIEYTVFLLNYLWKLPVIMNVKSFYDGQSPLVRQELGIIK